MQVSGAVASVDCGSAGWGGKAFDSPTSGTSFVVGVLPVPSRVITVAVRWYLRYGLSYRDIDELLAERGIEVDHVTLAHT